MLWYIPGMSLPPPFRILGGSAAAQAPAGLRPATKTPVGLDEFQQAVVACEAKLIVAEAFAGAGKTTMAVAFAAARPRDKFLYLCFGKANQVEAAARFGANTECRTGHSLAYRAVGYKFKDQLVFSWKVRDLASQLRIGNLRSAAVIQDVLNLFFASTDLVPHIKHVAEASEKWNLLPNEFEALLAQSKLAWSKMQQPGSGISLPQDAYLKMWALTNPKLTAYSHIILDEAQDTNPVMAQVVAQQTHTTRLLVGDRHQSVFLFRGAVNAMETFAATGATVMKMPRTWRFGPQIASVANDILGFFKGENTKIIGAGPGAPRRREDKRAVLARTNAGLYGEAAAVLGKDTHWIGGIEQYKIEALLDSYLLKAGRRHEILDPGMRNYLSWNQYTEEAERTKDGESRMLIKLNDQYGQDVPSLVKSLRANELKTEAGAKLILTTTHKAKGLDFDRVTLAEDFECTTKALDELKLQPDSGLSVAMAQEINLLYVGITRARHQLDLNRETAEFLKRLPIHESDLQELRSKHSTTFEEAPN